MLSSYGSIHFQILQHVLFVEHTESESKLLTNIKTSKYCQNMQKTRLNETIVTHNDAAELCLFLKKKADFWLNRKKSDYMILTKTAQS